MSIVLIIFWFDVLAAFICAATERFFLCGVNVVLAVLLAAFIAMVYEGRLLNRVKKLEEEVALLRRGTIICEHLSQINDK